jgi:signal transduction histidine kinase/DNA-binding response OmpR family regulator
MSGKAISQMVEDARGNLWIGTEDGGINYFNVAKQTFKQYNQSSPQSLSYINVHALHLDADSMLWIGTYLGGLNRLFRDQFSVFRANDGSASRLISDNIYAVHSHGHDTVYVGTTSGLCVLQKSSSSFNRVEGSLGRHNIYHIFKDHRKNLWVGCAGAGVFFKEESKQIFTPLHQLVKDTTSTFPSYVIDIQESSDGTIWIGTQSEGLFKLNTSNWSLQQIRVQDGLPDNTIYGIIEDDGKKLWLSTNNGLARMDMEQHSTRTFTIDNGLPNNQFNFKSSLKHSDGTIYMGTINGLISFNPSHIKLNTDQPDVRIVSLSVHNKEVKPGDDSGILKQPIYTTREIELNADQTTISFDFAAIDYTAPNLNRFKYKLDGLEDHWNEVGSYSKSAYANIPPGRYTLRVIACNNDGYWNTQGASLSILVHPPFWLSPWGYSFYALMIILGLWLYRLITIRRAKEKAAVQIERIEKENIIKINQLKIRFFTNISHEFRTPLSLIIDPLNRLLEQEPEHTTTHHYLQLISRNTQRLHQLINRLLEFRKTESGQLRLQVTKGNLGEFIKDLCHGFSDLADKKQIAFQVKLTDQLSECLFDRKVVDSVIYNLLSNAFKHTPDGGLVSVELSSQFSGLHKLAILRMKDSGQGIDKDQHEKIFDHFYQVENRQTDTGSGIGLALVKNLVKLHHGSIQVQSEINQGATFEVQLPVDSTSFSETERLSKEHSTEPTKNPTAETLNQEIPANHTLEKEHKGSLLIVDDNAELLSYLQSQLSLRYKVRTATNGLVAWEMIQDNPPDLIISDVMMPKLNGFELCAKVKNNLGTSHIPLILLTAKNTVNDKADGLQQGADIYLEKPFHSRILEAHIVNLFRMKRTLQERFRHDLGVNTADITRSDKDTDFLNKAIKTVQDNLDNADFKIPDFALAMTVSRSLLHLKLKELTGKSALEFIQTIRLKEAAQKLRTNQYTITEVAEMTGFNDAAYFSKCFKKHFEKLPKQFQKDHAS